jgi:putative AlgH/UPF0301 family transcriptional regulator
LAARIAIGGMLVPRTAIMSLRKRFLFATLFLIVAVMAAGRAEDYTAGPHAPMNSRLRAPIPGPAIKAFRTKSELLPAAFLPIQFRSPESLGVGKLLVASRGMDDPHFAQTVILLVRDDDDGVLGLVLNRRTDVPLSKVLDLDAAKDRSDPLYLGGPVGMPAVFALFQSSAKMEKAENIFGGVYLISDETVFDKTISARPDSSVFHVYLGYAGWTQDQLRAEVQLGAWFVFPADAAAVFNSDPNSLWPKMIRDTELKSAKNDPSGQIYHPVPMNRE